MRGRASLTETVSEAVICDGLRTPIGRYAGALASVRTDDLAAIPIRALLERNPSLRPEIIDEVLLGCANQAGEDNRNVARMAALLAGLPVGVPGVTLNRLCASGLDSVGFAARGIGAGDYVVAVAGGVESMTRAPFVMPKPGAAWSRTNEVHDSTIGWRFVNPAMAEAYGTDAMPETADNVAETYDISRADQDAFALRSQERWAKAEAEGIFRDEITPVYVPQRKGDPVIVDRDEHPRPGTNAEGLAKLSGINGSDRTVTAGNASGVNDGAAGGRGAWPDTDGAHPRHGVCGRRTPRHGHWPDRRLAETAGPAGPDHRGHGRDRTERGVCRAGAGRAARARPSRRRGACEPERRRHRAWSSAGHVGGAAGADGGAPAQADGRALCALHDVRRGGAGHGTGDRADLTGGGRGDVCTDGSVDRQGRETPRRDDRRGSALPGPHRRGRKDRTQGLDAGGVSKDADPADRSARPFRDRGAAARGQLDHPRAHAGAQGDPAGQGAGRGGAWSLPLLRGRDAWRQPR